MADNYEIDVTLEETFGTGVRSVEQTVASTESGGQNEITVTLTNDQQNKFYVLNGQKGADGKDGGYPVAVSTMSEMTDTSVVYLYERETYSWNGIAWVSNGTYGAPATYITKASETEEIILDQQGNHVATVNGIALDGLQGGNPIQSSFETKLYAVTGENEDGALTQKATSEAIDAAQFLPVVNYPGSDTSVVSGVNLMVDLKPNKLYKVSGIGTAYTYVAVTLTGNKLNALNRFYMQFTTGGTAVRIVFPSNVVVPSAFSIKTQTRYDIIIEDRVAKIWEDGNAVGDVLDATATAGAVAAWLDGHPEATTTVADGSITTAKLASGVIDANLRTSGAAADAKAVGDELTELKSQISDIEEQIEGGTGSGLTEELKSALDSFASSIVNLVEYVGFADETDGRSLIDAVSDAKDDIHNALYPPVLVTGISAVYTQSDTVYASTALNDLKSDLVVTASYSDGTSGVISDYELSGTLAVGTSTVTVTYAEFVDTFDVTVSDTPKDYEVGELLYNWDFTKSLTDTVGGSVITLMGSATQDANGITLPSNNSYASVPNGVFKLNRIVEVDVASTNAQFGNVLGRFLMTNNNDKGVIYRYNVTWNIYAGTAWTDNTVFQDKLSSKNAFSGSMFTLAIVNKPKIYKDGVLMGTGTSDWRTSSDFTGNGSLGSGSNGFYNATITGMRVYAVPSN